MYKRIIYVINLIKLYELYVYICIYLRSHNFIKCIRNSIKNKDRE